jgi:pimeloyl-ACP methyl ester carboxylesterase
MSKLRTLLFNGWAAGAEIWENTSFQRDWTFSYIEQLDGLSNKVMEESSDVLLVGFSMGGSNVLKALLDWPDKVRAAVFVSASVRMMEERSEIAQGATRGEVIWRGLGERRFAALRFGTQCVYKNDPSELFSNENLERGLDFLRATDLRERLEAFSADPRSRKIPMAIISSERDGIVSPDNAAFLKKVFPQAYVFTVPGNEHTLSVTVPEIIDAAVAEVKKLALREGGLNEA